MYHKIAIHKLSPAQIGKLLRGHRIRVKHGSGSEIHASEEQYKKIGKAHQKGCGTTIQFDPYQMEHHRFMRGKTAEGIFGNIAKVSKVVGHTLAPVARKLAPVVIDAGSKYLKSQMSGSALAPAGSALFPAGYGVNPDGLGIQSSSRRKVGRPRGKPTGHGEGFFGDLAKHAVKGAVKHVAPIVIDAGSKYLKNKVAGSGASAPARKGRRGKGMHLGRKLLHTVEHYGPTIAEYAPLALL